MESKKETKDNQNNQQTVEKWSNSSSGANQSDTIFQEIEIEDNYNDDDDDDDDEINQKLHISPNLIYKYQNNSPHFAKDESNGFIDSMSDIYLIESLSFDNLNQKN